jgi:hypothetical protein
MIVCETVVLVVGRWVFESKVRTQVHHPEPAVKKLCNNVDGFSMRESSEDDFALRCNSFQVPFLEREAGYASEVWVDSKEWASGMTS